jgi:RimJ/RimL family protein N-acetyltransferase
MNQDPRWLGSAPAPAQALEQPPSAAPANEPGRADAQATVPIRSLSRSHARAITRHLLALPPQDRYLRFGYAATDEQIRRYVERLNFERDELLGIFNRRLQLIAMAHLAFSTDPRCLSCAEFGVSVSRSARGRGYGSQLFGRAVVHARNEGVQMLFIHALSENTAMLRIARKAGATIERDGPEAEAHLRLPPADFDSRVSELVDRQRALTDYHLKAQARLFWRVLSGLQSLPQDVLRRMRL